MLKDSVWIWIKCCKKNVQKLKQLTVLQKNKITKLFLSVKCHSGKFWANCFPVINKWGLLKLSDVLNAISLLVYFLFLLNKTNIFLKVLCLHIPRIKIMTMRYNKHLSAGSTVFGLFFSSVFVTSVAGGIVSRINGNNHYNSF